MQLGLQFVEVERERIREKEAQNDWLEALLIHLDNVDKLKGWATKRQLKVVSATL